MEAFVQKSRVLLAAPPSPCSALDYYLLNSFSLSASPFFPTEMHSTKKKLAITAGRVKQALPAMDGRQGKSRDDGKKASL